MASLYPTDSDNEEEEEEEDEDAPRPLTGFFFGNVTNRLRLQRDEGRYLGQEGREHIQSLRGEQLGAGADVATLRDAAAAAAGRGASEAAFARAPDAEDYDDLGDDDLIELPPSPPPLPLGNTARFVAAATAAPLRAAEDEDDYDMDVDDSPQQQPQQEQAPSADGQAGCRRERVLSGLLPQDAPLWVLVAAAEHGNGPELVRFARAAGPPPSRMRDGRRAASLRAAAEAAACYDEEEEEESEGEAAAAAAFAASPRGAVVAPPPRRVAALAQPRRSYDVVGCDGSAALGAAPAACFALVHQTEWEGAISWGDGAASHRQLPSSAPPPPPPPQWHPQRRYGELRVKHWEHAHAHADAGATALMLPATPPLRKLLHPQLLRMQRHLAPPTGSEEDALAATAAAAARAALLPRRNAAMQSGAWLGEVRWGDDDEGDAAEVCSCSVPLLLDLNDARMTFALRPTANSAASAAAATCNASAVVLPQSLSAFAPSARRRGALPTTAAGAGGDVGPMEYDVAALLEPFNISKDGVYAARGNDEVQLHRHAQRRPGPLLVAHALPALRLETAATYLRPEDVRCFHAPRAVMLSLLGRHAVQPLPHRIAGAVPGPDRPRAPPAAFQSVAELTARDGHVFVVEYSEQHPLQLSNPGMGMRRTCWYRKRSAAEVPPAAAACHGAEVQALEPASTSPFLCDIAPGVRMHALETRMFRAPVWEHPPQESDFLLVRTAEGKWVLRGMTRTAVVGHLEPHPAGLVLSPKPNDTAVFERNRVRLAVFRKLRAARIAGAPECINVAQLLAEFPYPGQTKMTLAKLINDICKPERVGSSTYAKLHDVDIPSEDALRELVSPEAVCAYESMQAGRERLRAFGINGLTLVNPKNSLPLAINCLPNDPAIRALAAAISLELQLCPWVQTREFLKAIQGRGTLLLDTSRQGPARRGHIIHYALRSVRTAADAQAARPAQPQRLQGTDDDLRRLDMPSLAAELRLVHFSEESIGVLSRWRRVEAIRKFSSRWARPERKGNAVCVRSQREAADKLVARMARMFGAEAARASDAAMEDDDEDEGDDSDVEDLARDIETYMLDAQDSGRAAAAAAAAAAATQKAAEEAVEAAAHLELQRVLHGGDPNAGKRLRLVRVVTVTHPGGRVEAPVRTVITEPAVLDAYREAQAAGRDRLGTVRAVLKAQGAAGKLPYPLEGTQPALVSGRQLRPELLARRLKDKAAREERLSKQRADRVNAHKINGLSAAAMQSRNSGPGGLLDVSGEGGVKLTLNFKVARMLAARLKPNASSLARNPQTNTRGGRGAARGSRRRVFRDSDEEMEEEEEDGAESESDRELGAAGLVSDSDSGAATTRTRRRNSVPPPAPQRTALDALNVLLCTAITRAKKNTAFADFVHPVNALAVPDYLRAVGGPTACMCISQMVTRCGARRYASRADLLADVVKLVDAAYAYNAPRDGRPAGELADPMYTTLADELMAVVSAFLDANKQQLEELEAAVAAERTTAALPPPPGGNAQEQ